MLKFIGPLIVLVALAPCGVRAGEIDCGALVNHFGPFDYRTTPKERRSLVEDAHFTPQVERLMRGQSTAVIGADINYVLSVFPNHPRALLAMMNLAQKEKLDKPKGSGFTVDCWFDRAVRFRPEDPNVRMLYGIYLLRKGRTKDGIVQLKEAESIQEGGGNANLYYNMGLAYFSAGDYEKSLKYAHQAYGLGFDLPGLRNKLKGVGKWAPPAPVSPAENVPDVAAPARNNEPSTESPADAGDLKR